MNSLRCAERIVDEVLKIRYSAKKKKDEKQAEIATDVIRFSLISDINRIISEEMTR